MDRFEKSTEKILSAAAEKLDDKDAEIQDILRKAQDAGASIGVATFTTEFAVEAKKLTKRSRGWLAGSAILGILTIAAAIGSYFWPPISSEAGAWENDSEFWKQGCNPCCPFYQRGLVRPYIPRAGSSGSREQP